MKQYLDQLQFILDNGELVHNRTGIDTLSVFGLQAKYDLRDGFPLVTTKRVHFSSIVKELIWIFIKGHTNIKTLGCNIWNQWSDENGELGPIYGKQLRRWDKYVDDAFGGKVKVEIDQMSRLLHAIKTDPDNRRLIISAWNVSDLDDMALQPCHVMTQFRVIKGVLHSQMYQRSADMPVGVPFNIASYALLTMMIAQECKLTPGVFTHTIGDAHIYVNQIDGVKEQLTREPLPLPKVEIADKQFFDITLDDIKLVDYRHYGPIKFDVAV